MRLAVVASILAFAFPGFAFAGYYGDYTTPEARACAAALESEFNDDAIDKYDPSNVTKHRVDITFLGVNRTTEYGGHKYESIIYYVDIIRNGSLVDQTDSRTVQCVLDDSNTVMGIEYQ